MQLFMDEDTVRALEETCSNLGHMDADTMEFVPGQGARGQRRVTWGGTLSL